MILTVELRRQIFRQTKQIEEANIESLPTKFMKYDGKYAFQVCRQGVSCESCGVAFSARATAA